jgi:hypothetical protein
MGGCHREGVGRTEEQAREEWEATFPTAPQPPADTQAEGNAVKPYDYVEAKRIDEALSDAFDDLSKFETRAEAVRELIRMTNDAQDKAMRLINAAASAPQPPASRSQEGGMAFLLDAVKKQLVSISVGGCNCDTKTPDVSFHEPTCRYRKAQEALDNVDAIAALSQEGGMREAREIADLLADLDTAKCNTGAACAENAKLRATLDLVREELIDAQNEIDLIAVIDAALAHDGGRWMEAQPAESVATE